MRLAIPAETLEGERRVATVPEVVSRLVKEGHEVAVQAGAGVASWHDDEAYTAKGATICGDAASTTAGAAVVCKVQAPCLSEVSLIPEGTTLVSFLDPTANLDAVQALASGKVTSLSFDLLPRISRAQSMDALSSQALVSGYRAVIVAAERIDRFLPMFMTAAGTVPPAKVLVLGAGVAGLQAIATARRLGAVVRANDVRPAAKEEVKSLGATFVDVPLEAQEGAGGYAKEQTDEFLRRQRELIGNEVASADIVITTAAVPGRRAPVLVTAEMVVAMAPGSVIVDLAAETGGNCELSVAGEEVHDHGVLIYGAKNMPSSMPLHASYLYSRNVAEVVGLISRDGELALDFDDEIVAMSCVTHAGEVRHHGTRELLEERAG